MEGIGENRNGGKIKRSLCSYCRVKHLCKSLCMSAAVCVSVLTYETKNEGKDGER